MELIATLVHNRNKAKKILKEVPNNSIVLFAEAVMIPSYTVRYYSEKKNLFVIYNDDYYANGKAYITMKGVDKGKLKWMVHKYYLWKEDYSVGWDPAPKLAPIVKIRGHTACVAICYEIAFIAGFNKLYEIGKMAKKAKVELLFMPANWSFNWRLPQYVSSIAFKRIPSLKVSLFSTRRELAFVSTKKKCTKITKRGWISIEI
jgi:hypothetical protein